MPGNGGFVDIVFSAQSLLEIAPSARGPRGTPRHSQTWGPEPSALGTGSTLYAAIAERQPGWGERGAMAETTLPQAWTLASGPGQCPACTLPKQATGRLILQGKPWCGGPCVGLRVAVELQGQGEDSAPVSCCPQQSSMPALALNVVLSQTRAVWGDATACD